MIRPDVRSRGRTTRAGPGRLLLPALLAWCAVSAGSAGAQVFPAEYWVAGGAVPLDIHADSFAVITETPVTGVEAEEIVGAALEGARAVRRMSDEIWILGMGPSARSDLAAGVLEVGADPRVRWAGFLVRTPDAREPAIVTDEFIVRFAPGLTRDAIDTMNAANGVLVVREPAFRPNQFVLRVSAASRGDALTLSNLYRADPRVVYAHPNWFTVLEPARDWIPSDPDFGQQWHLYNPGVVNNGTRADIHAPEAWDLERGDPDITIAVMEIHGYQVDHEDLAANLWDNPWEPSGTGDPFSKPGDEHGWNFKGCPSPDDPITGERPNAADDQCGSADLTVGMNELAGHGTQVAGVAAAVAENGKGGVGVCPGCRLMLIRLDVTATPEVRGDAFDYANHMGADVINFSIHQPDYANDHLINAVADAVANGRGGKGVPIAAAAPNNGGTFCTPTQGGTSSSSIANRGHALSVADTNDQDLRVPGSTFAPMPIGSCLGIVAPGRTFLTTWPGNTYGPVSGGTSFATPVVAGVMGLILSRNPGLRASEVYDILKQTADKVGGVMYDAYGHDDEYGHGRVNAYAALGATPHVQDITDGPDDDGTVPPWEVGARIGVATMNSSIVQNEFDVPGDGPLSEPVLYATWFTSVIEIPLLVDVQVGYRNRWGGTGAVDEARLALAGAVAVGVGAGGGLIYVGPSIGRLSVGTPSGTSAEVGLGVVWGYRWPLSAKLAVRLEGRYRWWSGLSTNEWGLALGVGVRLP